MSPICATLPIYAVSATAFGPVQHPASRGITFPTPPQHAQAPSCRRHRDARRPNTGSDARPRAGRGSRTPCCSSRTMHPSPAPWMQALDCPRWYQFTFTTVADAPRFMDSSTVGVGGYEDGRPTLGTQGHFGGYAMLDEAARANYPDDAGITLTDRHRAAALASAWERSVRTSS